MIRILHVLGGLNRGGAETMLMNIYRNIDKEIIQFDFVIHTNQPQDYEKEIIKNGGKIYRFPRYNIKNHFKYVHIWREFFNEHKEYKIIHGHQRGAAFIYLKIAKIYGLNTIMHSHSTSSRGGGIEKLVKNLLRYLMRKYVDYPLACSEKAGKWLFGSNRKFEVIKNGIDMYKYTFSASTREIIRKRLLLGNKIVIGHVGSFTFAKNHMFLIEIFSEFHKKYKNSTLLLIGDGVLRDKIIKKIDELGLQESVILLGVVPDVYNYLQAIDLFLFPSFFEGLPVSVVEAQASGLKCILSDSITNEVDLNSNLIVWKSLKENAISWSELLHKNLNYVRKDTSENICKMGYSVKKTVQEISNLYNEIYDKGN